MSDLSFGGDAERVEADIAKIVREPAIRDKLIEGWG